MALVLGGCSIKNQVPDFEYPESQADQNANWPRLGQTEALLNIAGVTDEDQDAADEDVEALERRAEALRRKKNALE